MSGEGKATGTRLKSYFKEAERLDPRNVSTSTHRARLPTPRSAVFPKRSESSIRYSILYRTTLDTLANKASIAQAEGDLPRASTLLAPLPLTADNRLALRIKIYQAILERHTYQSFRG